MYNNQPDIYLYTSNINPLPPSLSILVFFNRKEAKHLFSLMNHYIFSSSKPAFDLSLHETDELEDEKSEPVTQSIQLKQCGK